ncbi:MAG: aminotransferase class IV [Pirellulales bacterium]|nr:aminotransferase class IV [Pirellulales bacterium]
MSAAPEMLVFLNGRMIPASQAHLAIYDSGVVLGATVTEMTRTFGHQPFRLEDHVARLFRSLRYVRFDIGLSPEQVTQTAEELLAHNLAGVDADDDLGLIQFVTAGEYATYAVAGAARGAPTVCMHTFALPWELSARRMQHGVHLVTPAIRHVPPQCYDPKMKYRSRMHYYLADQEARLVDPDALALLLDLDGNLTETSGANFLLVERGTIVSPPERNILPGISRATVRELAAELGIPFVERDLQVFSAINADEAFLTSTPYCLLPVTRINGLSIAGGQRGPVAQALLDAWSRRVGLDIEQQIIAGAARRSARAAGGLQR